MCLLSARAKRLRRFGLFACFLVLLVGAAGARQPATIRLLRVGASNSPADKETKLKEKAAAATLQKFIRDETGLDNTIVHEKSWSDLADKLAKGQLHLGVFEGYEFGWAQQKQPGLRPLAIAVNGNR